MSNEVSVAVLVPCYNEEMTIAKVITDYKREIPEATIYVYDNNSSDATTRIALECGAVVVFEPRQGKGNVIRQMLRDIDADYYILVDGDDQHPAEAVHELLRPLVEGKADLVVGDRISNMSYRHENKRAFHVFGNNLVRNLIGWLFDTKVNDALTGYRAMNRYFAKTFPIISKGFEIEVEMYIHAIDKNWRLAEIPIVVRDRPDGSVSKLSTFRDGYKVIKAVLSLYKEYRPFPFYSSLGVTELLIGVFILIAAGINHLESTSTISMLISSAFLFVGFLTVFCGVILDSIANRNRKQYEMDVLQVYSNRENKDLDV